MTELVSVLSLHDVLLLIVAAGLGGFVFGIAGFAFGVVASLFLHHTYGPKDVIFIVVCSGFILNLASLPMFFREVRLLRAFPFLLGATLGLPLGLFVLGMLDAKAIRVIVGSVIIAYCLFALRQQRRAAMDLKGPAGHAADTCVGFAGGMVGGISGLGPLIPGVWYGLRGLSKADQRALAQPFGLYVQGAMAVWLAASGGASSRALSSVLAAAPAMLLAAWLGLQVFERISLQAFQRMVVAVCLVGAAALVARQL